MKCVKKNNEVKRVSDSVAYYLVNKSEGYGYCSKEKWKDAVRGPGWKEKRKEVVKY